MDRIIQADKAFLKWCEKTSKNVVHIVDAWYAAVEWADENPKEGFIDIDKACEWLVDNIYGYIEESQKYSGGYSIDLNSLVNDFHKAMEEQ